MTYHPAEVNLHPAAINSCIDFTVAVVIKFLLSIASGTRHEQPPHAKNFVQLLYSFPAVNKIRVGATARGRSNKELWQAIVLVFIQMQMQITSI